MDLSKNKLSGKIPKFLQVSKNSDIDRQFFLKASESFSISPSLYSLSVVCRATNLITSVHYLVHFFMFKIWNAMKSTQT